MFDTTSQGNTLQTKYTTTQSTDGGLRMQRVWEQLHSQIGKWTAWISL